MVGTESDDCERSLRMPYSLKQFPLQSALLPPNCFNNGNLVFKHSSFTRAGKIEIREGGFEENGEGMDVQHWKRG